jgi:hypothetical protein
MPRTLVSNTPANTLLPYYPSLTNLPLTEQFQQCDPLNGNYFTATNGLFTSTNRDLVTFEAIEAADAPVWVLTTTYTLGQVVNVSSGSPAVTTSYIAIAVSTNVPPPNASYWALYTGSTVTIYSAPDACTGRIADVVNYPVPVFESTRQSVEFLVTPSSVFTQASGQVWFLASSNLVYVCIRNL